MHPPKVACTKTNIRPARCGRMAGGGAPAPRASMPGTPDRQAPRAGQRAFARRTSVLRMSLIALASAFAVETAFGLSYGSLAIVTDGAHALLDCVVTAVLLVAVRMASRPPDARHTYGHGKAESLGGLFGGTAMLLIAAFFVYESSARLAAGLGEEAAGAAAAPGMLPAIAAGAYALAVAAFRIALVGRAVRRAGGAALRADLYHAVMDAGSTGLAIAGVALSAHGAAHGDFAAALVLGALLAALSVRLVHSSAMDLTDMVSPATVQAVRRAAAATEGVVGTGAVMVRTSGDTVFADVTVRLRADASFERAHAISAAVESSIKGAVRGAAATVHFEPAWDVVPRDARIYEIASSVRGVGNVHNVGTHSYGGRSYSSLHVMVDGAMPLAEAHAISDAIEGAIVSEFPDTAHATVHIEPRVDVPAHADEGPAGGGAGGPGGQAARDADIRRIIRGHPAVRRVGRIASFAFKDMLKVEADCSFDGSLAVRDVHDMTAEIERRIQARFAGALVTVHPEPA